MSIKKPIRRELFYNSDEQEIIKSIKENKILIYPTDTIYGLGCNALNHGAVEKIRKIKKRDLKPFSIIAPSIKWIKDNFIIDVSLKKYFPGPYTVILKKKNFEFMKWVSILDTLGIRIPAHPFTKVIQKSKLPFITTSLNISGQPHMTNPKNISEEIKNKVDIIIDQGILSGKPSTLVINGKEITRS